MFQRLPQGYDIVADTYRTNSLKNSERDIRGISSKIIVSSASSKVPRNQNAAEMLQELDCKKIYFSLDTVCYEITAGSANEVAELSSNQEEADTKLLLHTKHAIDEYPDQRVVIRSPSRDVDIDILFIAIFQHKADRIWIDYGTGDHRNVFNLNSVDMDADKKSALIGFHAVTSNDYVFLIFLTW